MAPAVDPPTGPPAPAPAPDDAPAPGHVRRVRLVQGVLLALLVVLVAALGYAQLRRSADYVALGRRQSLRRIIIPAPRGVIYDREHRILAGNRVRTAAVLELGNLRGYFLGEERTIALREHLTAAEAGRPEVAARARLAVVQRQLDRVNAITGRRAQLDAARLERAFAREHLTPFVLIDGLSTQENARLDAALDPSDPVQLTYMSERWYPSGSAAVHVLGRVRRELVRPPNAKDFATLNYTGMFGDSGIERQYDSRLQGRPGEAVRQIDVWGFPVGRPIESRDAMPGDDVVLSLDLDLQFVAERAMAATKGVPRGAAVAISVGTGEVLALASKPDFDLNTVSPDLASATKQRIDAAGGWFNRATQGLYPPGSTFKIFTTLAGLRRGTLHPDDVLSCDGFLVVNSRPFPCHHMGGHGDLSLREALAHSCNVFAYQVGLAAGADALAAEARRFHFGEPTGIELPSETKAMLVPDPAWKKSTGRGKWGDIDTANLSIGQGFLRCSPLQAACAMASLARNETLTVPTILFQPKRRPSGDQAAEPLGLAEGDYAALIEGLEAVVQTGIGQNAQVPGVRVAGKSGTAQITRKDGTGNVAWFVAFAPADHPEIAVAVAMEGDQPGTEFAGAEHAAPIVREIIAAYFAKRAQR